MLFDMDQLPCGCLVTSPDREILYVNRYFSDILNWRPESLTGLSMNVLLNRATQLFIETYVMPTVLREGQCREVIVSLTSPDGATYPKVASVRKVQDGNFAWIFLEAANRKKLFDELESARFAIQEQREKLEEITRTDDLTGLANRRDLDVSAQRVFLDAHRSNAAVSVLVIDIDRFKTVNDTHGHHIGDNALCAFADALKSTCRESDILARMGGDEFVCVLNWTDASDAQAVCRRLHEAVASIRVDTSPLTISIGLAVKPRHIHLAFLDVLKLADQALYNVKKNGRSATNMIIADAP